MNNDLKTTISSAVASVAVLIGYFLPKVGIIPNNVQDAFTTLCVIVAGAAISVTGYYTNKKGNQ